MLPRDWTRDVLVMLWAAAAWVLAVAALAIFATPWALLLLAGLLPMATLSHWLRSRRRRRLDAQPLPDAAREILDRRVSWYRRLSPERKLIFERDVQRALHEYGFEAVPGAEVTDELRVLASASIVLMTFGQGDDAPLLFRKVVFHSGSIQRRADAVYPHTEAGGLYRTGRAVDLSIPAFLRGWEKDDDGDHAGVHECAHALDYGDLEFDGVPWGLASHRVVEWRALIAEEMQRARTGRSFLQPEAAASETQLFAYLVEAFFERPAQVRAGHPRLNELLDECLGGPAAH